MASQCAECRVCEVTRQIHSGLADEKRSYTHALARYVVELCRHMTIQGVSQHLGLKWDMVKQIHKEHLQEKFVAPDLSKLRRIAIDEINLGRGRWKTIVMNLDEGAIAFATSNRRRICENSSP